MPELYVIYKSIADSPSLFFFIVIECVSQHVSTSTTIETMPRVVAQS